MSLRLNKYLSQSGVASRRSADDLISQGLVTVNGNVAELGQRLLPQDEVRLNGKIVKPLDQKRVVLKFNKPRGVVVTKKDKFAPVTVMDYLPPQFQHFYPVGRLDKLSSGLLLFTNAGDLAQKISHPSNEHEKEYHVEFQTYSYKSETSLRDTINKLTQQIVDPKSQSKPIVIKSYTFSRQKQIGQATVILREGKKREIRNLFESVGLQVQFLERVRIGTIGLGNLKPGHYELLSATDVQNLLS